MKNTPTNILLKFAKAPMKMASFDLNWIYIVCFQVLALIWNNVYGQWSTCYFLFYVHYVIPFRTYTFWFNYTSLCKIIQHCKCQSNVYFQEFVMLRQYFVYGIQRSYLNSTISKHIVESFIKHQLQCVL